MSEPKQSMVEKALGGTMSHLRDASAAVLMFLLCAGILWIIHSAAAQLTERGLYLMEKQAQASTEAAAALQLIAKLEEEQEALNERLAALLERVVEKAASK